MQLTQQDHRQLNSKPDFTLSPQFELAVRNAVDVRMKEVAE